MSKKRGVRSSRADRNDTEPAHGAQNRRGVRTQNDPVRLEYRPLSALHRWPLNPKLHDVGAISRSVVEFGFRDPIALNLTTGQIIEGHGRLDTLQALKAQGAQPPTFIVAHPDGDWLVPVLLYEMDETAQAQYALAHNRAQELGGLYDEDRLVKVLADLAALNVETLLATGYDADEVDALLRAYRLERPQGLRDQTDTVATSVLAFPMDKQQQRTVRRAIRSTNADTAGAALARICAAYMGGQLV